MVGGCVGGSACGSACGSAWEGVFVCVVGVRSGSWQLLDGRKVPGLS